MCVGSFFAGVGATIGTICVGIVIAAIVANIKMNKQIKKHNEVRKMAKIALSEGFTVIPEGTHIFKITEVTYKETFGKIEVKMETAKGLKHTERFSLIGKNGQPNEGAMNAFSFFAKTALDDFELTEIDHNDLVGRYMECVVEHDVQPSNKNPDKNVTFIRLADKSPAYGFDEAEVTPPATKKTAPAKAKGTPVTSKTGGINLDDLLG